MIKISVKRADLVRVVMRVMYPHYNGLYHFTYSDNQLCAFMPNMPLFGYNCDIKTIDCHGHSFTLTSKSVGKLLSILSYAICDDIILGIDNHHVTVSILWQDK